jgi:pimeloyl-ACP methyl ester carboxylesterase
MDDFTKAIGLKSFTIYLHDYGCPIGLRMCLKHPRKIERLIIQNGNAYEEGLGPQWDETKDYWKKISGCSPHSRSISESTGRLRS